MRHADKLRPLATVLLILFPLFSIAFKGGGSAIYSLLLFTALVYAWPQWKALGRFEKAWLLSLVLFFALGALSLLFSENLDEGWKRLDRYFRLMSLAPILLLLLRLRLELRTAFLVGLGVAALVLAGQAFYESVILAKPRVSGIYYAIGFGDTAVLTAALLGVALLTVAKGLKPKLLLLLAIALALYATLESVARGAWLFVPFFALLLLLLYWPRLPVRAKWQAGGTLALAVMLVVALQPATLTRGIGKGLEELQRYQDHPEQYSSWGVRINLWRVSLNIFKEHPLLGTGLGDFHTDNKRMVAAGLIKGERIDHYGHAHSIYFEALATTGLLGLLAMLIALLILPFVFFYRAWHLAREDWARFYALAGMTTVTAFAVFGLTEGWLSRNPFVNPYVIYIAILASGMSVTAMREPRRHV